MVVVEAFKVLHYQAFIYIVLNNIWLAILTRPVEEALGDAEPLFQNTSHTLPRSS